MEIYQEMMQQLATKVSKNIITDFTRVLGYGSQSSKLLSHICSSFILMQHKLGELLFMEASKIRYKLKKKNMSLLPPCILYLSMQQRCIYQEQHSSEHVQVQVWVIETQLIFQEESNNLIKHIINTFSLALISINRN